MHTRALPRILVAATLLAGCADAGDGVEQPLAARVSRAAPLHAAALPGYRRHVFLEYDYMVAPDGRSDAPLPESIDRVVDAFRAHDIDLVIEPRHDAIPLQTMTFGECAGAPGTVDFYALKAQYFDHHGEPTYHYAIFGDAYLQPWACVDGRSSGIAELPGTDFIVTLGESFAKIPSLLPSRPWIEGGTFMHELGHNLGLRHGGDDDFPWKPTHISVMSYWGQFGLYLADAPGSTDYAHATRALDYAGTLVPTLDENHLDERVGLQSGTNAIVSYDWAYPGSCLLCSGGSGVAAGTGPVDWNQNGVIEADVALDIDVDDRADLVKLTGYDEWSNLDVEFQRPPGWDDKPLPHLARDEQPPR